MNLNEITMTKKTKVVESALRDHFELKMNFDAFDLKKTNSALSKIRGLISEVKSSKEFYNSHNNSSYLKLVMLEQALSSRLEELKSAPVRIVVENEEVQKSQVILAAQDMIDNIQKMLEQVSKMNIEELDAVVNGIKNEFGSDAGETFNSAVSQTLGNLQSGIQSAKNELTSALGVITGESAPDASGMGGDMGMGEPMPGQEPDMGMGDDMGMNAPEELDEPEVPDSSLAGRERR